MRPRDARTIADLIDVDHTELPEGAAEAIRRIVVDGAPYLDVLAEVAGHPITAEVVGPYDCKLSGFGLRHWAVSSSIDDDEPAERYVKARAVIKPEDVARAAAKLLFQRWVMAFVTRHGIAAATVAHLAPLDEAAQQAFQLRSSYPNGWPQGCYLTATSRSGLDPQEMLWFFEYVAQEIAEEPDRDGQPSWERSGDESDHPEDVTAARLVGGALALTGAGMDEEQAVRTALDDVYREYEHEIDTMVRDAGRRVPSAVAGLVPLGEDTEDEPLWVVDGLLVRGEIALLAAPAFSGKTPFALDVAGAVASGRDVLGRTVKQGRVLYVTREESASEARRWLRRLGYDLTTLRPYLMLLARPDWADLATAAGGAALLRLVVEHGPFSLVVLDTLGRFVRGPENATETYSQMHQHTLDVLKGLGLNTPTVLILDHLSTDNSPRPRGATAKLDIADTVWLMKRTRGARDDDVTRHRLSHRGFVRIPRPSPVRFDRVYDDVGDCTFTAVGDEATDELDEDIETTIEEAVLRALPVESGRQLETVLRAEMGDSFKRNELYRVLEHLVETDQVETVEGKRRAVGYKTKE